MSAESMTAIFLIAVMAEFFIRSWLGRRQVASVTVHRDAVPAAFAGRVGLAAHQKAADYTVARERFAHPERLIEVAVLVAFTVGGGIAVLAAATSSLPAPWNDVALVVAYVLISGLIGLPFSWWRTFRVEARFGFNRTTMGTWVADLAKGLAVGAVLGIPLLLAMLWLMRHGGALWWLWAWGVWMAFQVLVLVLYPTVIAPLFNTFSPLPAGDARARIESLLARCGFAVRDLYVIDGSRRSAHGNAYFVGFGRARRIVFFDTLLDTLAPQEVESVLAHELGHYKLRHIAKRLVLSAIASLALLAALAWLRDATWFAAGLGVADAAAASRPGVALLLFMLALPPFLFLATPLSSRISRKHEFEADAFATANASAAALASALVKMVEENASTLTPDPLHSAFYDSHPPPALRIARLEAALPAGSAA